MTTRFEEREKNWRELADVAIARAKELGIELEVKFGASESLSVKVRKGKLDELSQSAPFGISMRAFNGKRSASAGSSHVDRESVLELVERVADNVQLVDEDEANGLPDAELLYQGKTDLDLFDPAMAGITVDQAMDMARRAEQAAFDVDKRITNSSGAGVGTSQAVSAIFNSRGLAAFFSRTSLSISASPVAEDDQGEKYSDGWWDAARFVEDLETPEAVGRKAGERCVALIGAEKVPTGKVPVLFPPETAKDLVDLLFGCVGGDAVYKDATFLAGKEGETVASPLVTLVDDPHRPRGLGSTPFDAEGVATSRQTVVEKGKLMFYPCDSFSGRRLKRKSTGHAGGGGGVTSHNLYLEKGETPPEEILAGIESGLFVTAFIGFSFNRSTGDFSRGVRGFWIDKGKLGRPVQEVTVSGNLGQMFQDVTAVGNDLAFRFGTDSPTLLIKEMTVSGS